MNENKNKKHVVLILSHKFPEKHISRGRDTDFNKKLLEGEKIHTIRSNYDLWKHNITKINKMGYELSVREWTGVPYRSQQREIKTLSKIGYESISMEYIPENKDIRAIINGKTIPDVKRIAHNDGLDWNDFVDWFFGNGTTSFQGIIVHFTEFRYA